MKGEKIKNTESTITESWTLAKTLRELKTAAARHLTRNLNPKLEEYSAVNL
jgi:hypothetical protein